MLQILQQQQLILSKWNFLSSFNAKIHALATIFWPMGYEQIKDMSESWVYLMFHYAYESGELLG